MDLCGFVFDTTDNLWIKRVRDIGNQHANGVDLLSAMASSEQIRRVMQLAHSAFDLFAQRGSRTTSC